MIKIIIMVNLKKMDTVMAMDTVTVRKELKMLRMIKIIIMVNLKKKDTVMDTVTVRKKLKKLRMIQIIIMVIFKKLKIRITLKNLKNLNHQ